MATQSSSSPHPTATAVAQARSRIVDRLLQPVDIASLVWFRIAFGGIMVWEVFRYFKHGWVKKSWIEPGFHFHYEGFHWLEPWSGTGMYAHFAVMGMMAIFIMAGVLYRFSCLCFALCFAYIFFLDEATYLNHFYLVLLISCLMTVVPANRAASFDCRWFPGLRSDHVPAWSIYLLRFQIGVPYLYGGIAKLNMDWLSGEPMRMWLAERTNMAVIGSYFTEEWVVFLFSYGGLLFDLFIVPALLWKRTRVPAFILATLFHLSNAWMFHIGIFPWFMIAATTIFFEPGWCRRIIPLLRRIPLPARPPARSTAQTVGLSVLALYVAFQVLFPFRHWLYEGHVTWTEEGHKFSWRMKLRNKERSAEFLIRDPATGQQWEIDPDDYLSSRQARKMPSRPNMVLQFAHHLGEQFAERGYENVEVYANVKASLNGRKTQYLIEPDLDLMRIDPSTPCIQWVTRMTGELEPRFLPALFVESDRGPRADTTAEDGG